MLTPSYRDLSPASLAAVVRKPVLLCFSHLRWNFVFQRPQHLMTRAARSNHVLFLEEPIHECGARAHLKISHPVKGVTVATPILPRGLTHREACLYQRSFVDELLASQGMTLEEQSAHLICWYLTPMALEFSTHLKPSLALYDCMDELSHFRDAPTDLSERERTLMARVGLVFTGGVSLYERKRRLHSNVHAFPSSIDRTHFARARLPGLKQPSDQVAIPRKRIGFFGVIDERLDTSLVADIARLRPDWQFVMLGPVVKIDPAQLPRAANLHWLGQKSYAELPAYLAGWDAGFMPFALNEATRYISPTKTPEFLSAGLPVVSTAITDVVQTYGARRFVGIGHDPADFVTKLEAEMAKPRTERLHLVDKFLATMSWDQTWDDMEALITQQRKPSAAIPRVRAITSEVGAIHV